MKKILLMLLGVLLTLPATALTFEAEYEGVKLKYTTLSDTEVSVAASNSAISGAIVIPPR